MSFEMRVSKDGIRQEALLPIPTWALHTLYERMYIVNEYKICVQIVEMGSAPIL